MKQDSIFNLNNIPEAWGIATLSEIAKNERNAIRRGPFGSAIKKSFFVPTGYKVYEQKNVIYNDFKRGGYYISDEKFNELESFEVKADDILMSCSGTVGKLSIVPSDFEKGIINQALLKITLNNNIIYTRFFFFLFGFNISRILQKNTRGSAMLNISSVRALKNIQFPIPPLTEQHRIIAKIEELFTKLDAGVDALKQAQVQLKRYRQSVLKAAVEGRLTAEWREQHLPASPCSAQSSKDELEPAEKLLERILKERREKWETQQLAKYKSNCKKPPQNWQDKYKEPTPPDTTNLPELPEGWMWVSIDQLIDYVTSGSRDWSKYYSSKGALFIRTQNINTNKLIVDNVAKVNLPENVEGKRSLVKQWDLLAIITGANYGKVALVTDPIEEAYVSQSVALIRLVDESIAQYLHLNMILEVSGLTQLQKLVYGMGRPVLNLKNIRDLVINLPPIEEQKKLTKEVQKSFSCIENCESLIKLEIKRSQSLRQSILKRAFEGKLVPQDPKDEPASVLLERIKAEKTKPKKSKQMEIQ